jgi:hypothetical protein
MLLKKSGFGNYLEKRVTSTINSRPTVTIICWSYILAVSKCVFCVIRPDIEVVSLSRILRKSD